MPMQIPIVVETLGQDQYRAEAPAPFSVAAEGKSSAEAVQNLRARIEKEFSNGRHVVMLDVALPHEPAWAKFVGHLKNEPLFDQWQSAIREYRQKRDVEDGIDADEQA